MDSHTFYVNPPSYFYDTVFFKYLTFKIQDQSHSSKSHNRYNILLTHIPFIPCWSTLPLLRCSYLKIDLENPRLRSWVRSKFKVTMWVKHPVDSHPFRSMSIWQPNAESRFFQNLTLKFKGQGHGWGHSSKSQCGSSILLTHIPFVPCQSALPFLRYSILKILPWKSRVKVMDEVTVQSHNVGLTSYRFTSLLFHVNQPSHSWDTSFSKFDLENQNSGQMTLMLHNYRSGQFHRTSNAINPSSGFKDMGSAKSA